MECVRVQRCRTEWSVGPKLDPSMVTLSPPEVTCTTAPVKPVIVMSFTFSTVTFTTAVLVANP